MGGSIFWHPHARKLYHRVVAWPLSIHNVTYVVRRNGFDSVEMEAVWTSTSDMYAGTCTIIIFGIARLHRFVGRSGIFESPNSHPCGSENRGVPIILSLVVLAFGSSPAQPRSIIPAHLSETRRRRPQAYGDPLWRHSSLVRPRSKKKKL